MAESIASESVTTPARKRGRPAKAASMQTAPSLTRTTRKTSKTRPSQKAKTPAKAVVVQAKISILNRVVNMTVVAAVFVTALAIQRIVPTETLTTPKVESLIQTATAALAPTPAPEVAAATPVIAKVEAPKTKMTPSKKYAPVVKASRRNAGDVATPLNSGGSQDLDAEATRAAYMAASKLATRTAQPAPTPAPAK